MCAAVTYFPELDAFIADEHMSKPDNWKSLEMRSREIEPIGTVNFDARCANYSMMKLILTYCRVKKFQRERLYLDRMFNDPDSGKETDGQGETPFELQNSADTYEVPVDLINSTLSKDNPTLDIENVLLRKRERKAQVALQRLRYHYQKDGDGKMKFRRPTAPVNNDVQRISNPVPCYAHDSAKTLREIHECRAAFEDTFKRRLTSIACYRGTADKLICGTHMYKKIESASDIGMVCEFPDMEYVRMVASAVCPRNVLYAASEHALLKYEGPKIIRQTQPSSQTVRDFNLYRCAHEDPSEDRTLGFIIDLQTM